MDDNNNLSALSADEQERLKKIEKLDSNQSRKRIIFACVTVFLVALFAFGTVFGAKYILSYEGTQALPETDSPDTVYFENDSAIEAIENSIDKACSSSSVKLDIRNHVSIPEEDIHIEADNSDREKVLKFIRGSIESKISSLYSSNDKNGSYGEDFSDILPVFEFSSSDTQTAELKTNEENTSEIIGHISFKGCNKDDLIGLPVYTAFDMNDTDDFLKSATELFVADVIISIAEIKYDSFDIYSYSQYSGKNEFELNKLIYSRSFLVSFDAEFIDSLAPYGKQKIEMRLNIDEEYIFTRVKFDISNDIYFIEKGDSDEINRKIISDEGVTDIKVTWESSAPDILSVDKKGFYKGHKISEEPVTVTGRYTYNGIEYSDTVLFYVREPVESVKLSENSLTLKTGDQTVLSPKIKPENATFKNVFWFSTDENVVTVDENGKITAVSPGEAGVYVITFDGNFKKTCAVSVIE